MAPTFELCRLCLLKFETCFSLMPSDSLDNVVAPYREASRSQSIGYSCPLGLKEYHFRLASLSFSPLFYGCKCIREANFIVRGVFDDSVKNAAFDSLVEY